LDERIIVVDADPRWEAEFESTARAIRVALPDSLKIDVEHFGSTAVPGCAAKPIIDVLLVLPGQEHWPVAETVLPTIGFQLWIQNPDPHRRLFIRRSPSSGSRTHHIHLRMADDIATELAFRDLLRRDPGAREEYALLKRHLATLYRDDRVAYSDGKTELISRLLLKSSNG
jgi:GrpB-like predicted nucleotidyltransferase (UPF0157 family)